MTSRRAPGSRRVEITVLGEFRVVVDGSEVAGNGWRRRWAAALVKVLALAPGHRLHREHAIDVLWPSAAPGRAISFLHKAAHYARRATGCGDAVVVRDDFVWLFPGAEITVDAVRFEQLARNAIRDGDADAAREAAAWYGGDLLPGDRYEDWAADRRVHLHLRYLDVLRVARQWREVTELEPTDERAHVELMRQQLTAGDPVASLRQYAHLERVLERELGAAPGEPAQRAFADARLDALLTELADLVERQHAVLSALAGIDATAYRAAV